MNPNNLTNEQVKQGFSTIEGPFNPVTGQLKSPSVITANALQPQTPINLQGTQAQGGNGGADMAASGLNNVNTFAQDVQQNLDRQAQFAPDKSGIDSILAQLTGAETGLTGRGQTQLDAEVGVNQMRDLRATTTQPELKSAYAEYNALKTDFDKASADLEVTNPITGGRDIRASVLMGQQGAIERAKLARLNSKASEIGLIEARDLALSGRIDEAQKRVDRAIDLKYADREAVYATKLNQYNRIKESLTAEEKKVGDAMEAATKKEAAALAEKKQVEKDAENRKMQVQDGINKISLMLSENGVNPSLVKNAETVEEAIQLAGARLQDPAKKFQLAKLQLEIQRERKAISLMGTPTATERKAEAKALASKAGQTEALQGKLDLIGIIETSSGLNQRVGPNIQSRIPRNFLGGIGKALTVVGIPDLIRGVFEESTGSGQQFAGAVHRLASNEFLDALINAKKQGATFGALTDREGDALRAAATQLNDWEIKDKTGKGLGIWNIDERSFKTELTRIKSLTQKAGGGTISQDEQQLLDTVFGNTQTDPSSYFQ